MKKLIIVASVVSLILSSCGSDKLARYSDDIYANPSEERIEKARLAAAQKKQEEENAKREAEQRADELAAQKAKDDANPLYKDPNYNKDDYYDYQYASRIRRFNNPVNGVGYYDNYYTNNYFYSGNPNMYGSSIYSSYNYWGPNYSNYNCWPSSYFGVSYGYGSPGYNSGFGYGSGFGYNPYGYYGYNPGYGYGCNPYMMGYSNGYNNGYYNGFYGYPYGSSFGYGYPYGGYSYGYPYYGSGYNNGWGYYNGYDVNSGYNNSKTNAPRGSHDGGNGGRVTNPGKYDDGVAQRYIQQVQSAQSNTPKFTDVARSTKTIKEGSPYNFGNSNNVNIQNGNYNEGRPNTSGSNSNNNLNNAGNAQFNTYNHNSAPKNNNLNTGNNNEAQFNTYPNNGNTPPKNTLNNGTTNEAQFQYGNTQPTRNHNNANYNNYNNNNNNNTPKGNIFDSGSPSFNMGGGNSPSPSGGGRGGSGSGGGGGRPR